MQTTAPIKCGIKLIINFNLHFYQPFELHEIET